MKICGPVEATIELKEDPPKAEMGSTLNSNCRVTRGQIAKSSIGSSQIGNPVICDPAITSSSIQQRQSNQLKPKEKCVEIGGPAAATIEQTKMEEDSKKAEVGSSLHRRITRSQIAKISVEPVMMSSRREHTKANKSEKNKVMSDCGVRRSKRLRIRHT